MSAASNRDRPRKAPAIAVEHRQRPQIDGMLGHAAGQHIALAQEIGAAVMVDDALGIAGGPGRVEQTDRLPLIGGSAPLVVWIVYALGLFAAVILAVSVIFVVLASLLGQDSYGLRFSALAFLVWGALAVVAAVTWLRRRRRVRG